MTDDLDSAARLVETRLYRLDGAVNTKRTRAGPNGTAIDFTLGFPSGGLVDIPEKRRGGIGNSVIYLNERGEVEDFLLRMPPLPADEYDNDELKEVVGEMAEELADGFDTKTLINPGTGSGDIETWWPHISLNVAVGQKGPDAETMMVYVRELYQQYRQRFKGGL